MLDENVLGVAVYDLKHASSADAIGQRVGARDLVHRFAVGVVVYTCVNV
jgi:hypothetical protein